jgi:ABC-2 type transport system permease protein
VSTPQPNLSEVDTAAAVTPATSGVANRSGLRIFTVLVRRELWEHRVLWIAPLVVAVLLLATAFLAHVGPFPFVDDDGVWHHDQSRAALFGLMEWGLTVPQYLVMLIVLSFYLVDCLYAERKDRGILFWKSMPISDAATVTSKLLTALVIVPLGVYVLTLVTSIVFEAIMALRVSLGYFPPGMIVWNTVVWLKVQALMLYGVIVSMFWYSPAAAYLILISAWARRNVTLWATLPPVVVVLIERFAFGTHYLSDLIQYRTFGIWEMLNLENSVHRTVTDGSTQIVSLPGIFDTLEVGRPFLNIDLWLGIRRRPDSSLPRRHLTCSSSCAAPSRPSRST